VIRNLAFALALASVLGAQGALADPIKRAPSSGPIAISPAVTAPPGSTLVFLSGALPTIDKAAPGTTETQTRSVLDKLEVTLKAEGLSLADVVKATVFLVGDPAKGGELDFAGLNAAWSQRFGTTDQPNKPARSTVKVAGLVAPGALVEIEVVAARGH
jgi:enamine deaminase RidA (YjgF/YER057c/UK114 family)